MDNNTCCFTGHRIISNQMSKYIADILDEVIDKLYQDDILRFLVGGAIGFDTLSAEAVLRAKKKYSNICLILILPCIEQSKYRNVDNIARYEKIKQSADKIICLADRYYDGCMQARNRYLIDNSMICIAYLNRMYGGTFYTVNYAISKGRKVINLAQNKIF